MHRPDAKFRVNVIHAGSQKETSPSPAHSFRENCTVYPALSGCPVACPIARSELRARNKKLAAVIAFYERCVRTRYGCNGPVVATLPLPVAVSLALNTSIYPVPAAAKPNFLFSRVARQLPGRLNFTLRFAARIIPLLALPPWTIPV